ncbi:ribonuclease D [Emcibacter nanhaiensis]|uniref:Ribonuclease D n=1 Tax=Emcibacter nanhaiensis TaxID=1505037 RepID=A0A501PSL2_9PROT|nr:ribonuclease D [Emcibacter nanhaiensis]TPD63087.1 ribonuclease D [Emcibacter nanhaiensis]
MSVITKNQHLAEVCERLSSSEYVTVDTEFLRDKTYYSKLCLIQIANEEEYHAIDPLADGIDLAPFYDLMANENVIKVFHAARQDIEIFVNETGNVPMPLFDTQVAAMVCGFGDSIGYDKLVASLAGKTLDKSSRFTDWSRRPLTQRQIDYALGDVTHLRVIYRKLRDQLDNSDRTSWLDEEMEQLTSPQTYITHPEEAWKRIKIRNNNRRFHAIVRKLAEWREMEAQRRNTPRNRIMRDEVLLEVAAIRPQHSNSLNGIRGLPPQFGSSKPGAVVLDYVKQALDMPDEELPEIARPKPPAQGVDAVMELLKVLLKHKCQKEGVANKLVATMDDLEKLAADDEADIPALHGWRRALFGKDALALKHGKLGFSMKDGEIILFPLED